MEIDYHTVSLVASYLGSAVSIGFGAVGAAIGEGKAAAEASLALSENPKVSADIVKTMLVGQAVAESAAIFALVVAILLLFVQPAAPGMLKAAALAGAGLSIGLGALGSGIGSGMPAGEACRGIARDPEITGRMTTTMLVGSAVCQTPAILSMVVALMLIFINFGDAPLVKAAALLGAGLCMGLGAIGPGIGSGHPAGEACKGLSRQPASAGSLTANMLVGSAVSQTPAIFAMVVALVLMLFDIGDMPFNPAWGAFLGAALSTGLSAIGSGYGCGLAAGACCEGVARHPENMGRLTTVMLVGQAVAQTPCIFGLVVSFILIFRIFPETSALAPSMALLSAGLCMGFGGIGPGLGNGMAAEGAVRWVARQVKHVNLLMRIMLVGQAVAQSTAIYALVISLLLIFVL